MRIVKIKYLYNFLHQKIINIVFNKHRQLLLTARLSHRNSVRPFVLLTVLSVCLSVCHADGSVKNGPS